jgi:Putative MetA-pathway of phenol degradation
MAVARNTRIGACALLAAFCWFLVADCMAQDLEPRRWSQLPVGMNVFGVGGGRTDGDIFFDPVLQIDDATFELYGLGASYVRSFEWLGKNSRFDAVVPYARGRWEGLLNGEAASRVRSGFGDPRLRFSVTLFGAPPLSGKAYLQYRQNNPVNTTIGAALDVALPLGEYNSDWLINLGANRYVFRPQLGILHQRREWQFELTGSVFLYQDNNEFWKGTRLEQDPLWFVQGHVIYGFRPGWWISVSGGYAYGGEAYVNDVAKNNDARSTYWALSLGMPLGTRQALKFAWASADTHVRAGANSNALLLAWSFRWSR